MTTPRTRHLRLIAAEMTDEHAAETVRGAADKIEQLREQLVIATTPQPMSTAPRDGTIIDLWLTGGSRMTDQWWDEEDQSWCGMEDSMFSHWSPIPGYAQTDDLREDEK